MSSHIIDGHKGPIIRIDLRFLQTKIAAILNPISYGCFLVAEQLNTYPRMFVCMYVCMYGVPRFENEVPVAM
jgi:hypothetical protein